MSRIGQLINFSGAYIKQKLGSGFEAVVEGLVSLDPDGATEAQLDLMQQDLEKAAKKFAVLQQDKLRELKEANDANMLYEQAKKAALLVNNKIQSEPEKAESLKPLLVRLVDEAEAKKASWEKEQLEADNVTKLVDMLDQIVSQKHQAIEKARKALAAGKTAMLMAEAKKSAHQMQLEIEAMDQQGPSTLNVALSAMQKKAADMEADVAASEKLASLKRKSDVFQDEQLKAILAEAEGSSEKSITDRLANL